MSRSTDAKRNYVLYTRIQKKGATAKQVFYEVLKEAEPYLMRELEG